jgi:hypothetical protein
MAFYLKQKDIYLGSKEEDDIFSCFCSGPMLIQIIILQ